MSQCLNVSMSGPLLLLTLSGEEVTSGSRKPNIIRNASKQRLHKKELLQEEMGEEME